MNRCIDYYNNDDNGDSDDADDEADDDVYDKCPKIAVNVS